MRIVKTVWAERGPKIRETILHAFLEKNRLGKSASWSRDGLSVAFDFVRMRRNAGSLLVTPWPKA